MALVDIDKEVAEAFRLAGIELTEEMYELYLKTGVVDFNINVFIDSITKTTVNGIIKATELGLAGSGNILVGHDVVSDYFLFKDFKGGNLSDRLRWSGKEATKIMEKTVNDHIKARTNWKSLSKDLTQKGVSKANLPKYLDDLNASANRLIGNPDLKGADLTKAQKELNRTLKNAKRQVEKLAQNGAPTKSLRAAYRKVIRAVEKGDLDALKAQMDYAMEKKVLYNNQRIARTELARADSLAFQRSLEDSPHIEMVQILLDARHNVIDECDFITQADLYGRGKGVYPKDRYPQKPFHPHCLCDQIMVSIKRDGARFSNERAEEYFSKLPKHKRKAMLQGGFIKDWEKDLKGYEGELQKPPKPLPKRLVKSKVSQTP